MKLVDKFNWTWILALEYAILDTIATRIKSLKDIINTTDLIDNAKYQIAITYYICTKYNISNSLVAQYL